MGLGRSKIAPGAARLGVQRGNPHISPSHQGGMGGRRNNAEGTTRGSKCWMFGRENFAGKGVSATKHTADGRRVEQTG